MVVLLQYVPFCFWGIPFLIVGNFVSDSGCFYITLHKKGKYHKKVICSETTCTVKVYQIVNGIFTERLSMSGFIGCNGSGKTMEGDGKTPIDTFTVGNVYGIANDPGSIIPYTKVTNDMY